MLALQSRLLFRVAPKIITVWLLAICISIPPVLGWRSRSVPEKANNWTSTVIVTKYCQVICYWRVLEKKIILQKLCALNRSAFKTFSFDIKIIFQLSIYFLLGEVVLDG